MAGSEAVTAAAVTNGTSKYVHPSGDTLLTAVGRTIALAGDLVRSYPGRASLDTVPGWLDDWFRRRVERAFAGEEDLPSEPVPVDNVARPNLPRSTVVPVRLISVEPHYFRGFRALKAPINLDSGLVVVDGKNSSGKTSLAEALEWLFTGALSRRSLGGTGNARELEKCVGNEFRPPEDETWVEAAFRLADGSLLRLRRVLDEDYGATETSRCTSRLFRDGTELPPQAEAQVLDTLFGGCPPLLMQHTLRLFVHSRPSDRRDYFERLLQLDELTLLIEKAVIGDARLADFPSSSGSVSLRKWEKLKAATRQPASSARLRKIEKEAPDRFVVAAGPALQQVAAVEFLTLVPVETSLSDARTIIDAEQRATRQRSFPLLRILSPKRSVDDSLASLLSAKALLIKTQAVTDSLAALALARSKFKEISEAQLAVARALSQLSTAGLVGDPLVSPMVCPICDYQDVPTLSPSRVAQVRSWDPAGSALQKGEKNLREAVESLTSLLRSVASVRLELIPAQPTDQQWADALVHVAEPVRQAAEALRKNASAAAADLASLDQGVQAVQKALAARTVSQKTFDERRTELETIGAAFDTLIVRARTYAASFDTLEKAVGVQATEDTDYSLRNDWLAVVDDLAGTAEDLSWEAAKRAAQDRLKRTREYLIGLRKDVVERRRNDFSARMTQIWKTLREDRYSAFSKLYIPEPRGKGFPIEIQVKAVLDDGVRQAEVDALRVFSESQVNVLGIAAFVTRLTLLGQRIAVFDDPVQSMDEDHFKSFASDLINLLIDDGLQIIILTHNDTFARDVSFAQDHREDYATIEISHKRKTGCRAERDNRRVQERLRRAEKCAEDGKVSDGWKLIRLAIERLYTLIYKKHQSGFDPASWSSQAADYMFNAGVGTLLERTLPGSGGRLKEILDMATAGGHDKAARGQTDLLRAVSYIRDVAKTFNIVD